jgi:hypothetical protein
MKRVFRAPVLTGVIFCMAVAAACGGPVNQNNSNAGGAGPQPSPSATRAQSNLGQIKVASRPAGATILLITEDVGGIGQPQPRGSTPATIADLAPGKYVVHLEKPGYKSFQKSIEVKPNETTNVTAQLQAQR